MGTRTASHSRMGKTLVSWVAWANPPRPRAKAGGALGQRPNRLGKSTPRSQAVAARDTSQRRAPCGRGCCLQRCHGNARARCEVEAGWRRPLGEKRRLSRRVQVLQMPVDLVMFHFGPGASHAECRVGGNAPDARGFGYASHWPRDPSARSL